MSPTLFRRARELGIDLDGRGTRTVVLSDEDVADLGLDRFLEEIQSFTDRKKTKIVLYKSERALDRRGTHIRFERGLR